MQKKRYLGLIYLMLSAIIFSAATVVVRIAATRYNLPATQISFARFSCGLVLTLAFIVLGKREVRPVKVSVLVVRAVFNCVAVILFFVAIEHTGVIKGNIYNLTYPVFVALFSPFFLAEHLTLPRMLAVTAAFGGAYLVSGAGAASFTFGLGDLAGILSGLTAGFAIIALRKARLTESSLTILLFLMAVGTLFNGVIFFHRFIVPDLIQTLLLLLTGLLSFLGQMCITYGYRYIDALPGAVISTSRIFISAVMGIVLLGEMLTLPVALGGILIFMSVAGLSYAGKNAVPEEA